MRRALIPILFAVCAALACGQSGLTITPSTLPAGQVGSYYFQQLGTTGNTGQITWSLAESSLPPGFVFDTSAASGGRLCTGVVNSGTTGSVTCTGVAPTSALGSWSFTVEAFDSGSDAYVTKLYVLTISAASPLTITSISPLPNAYVGQPYSYQFTSNGGAPPISWLEFSALSTFPPSFSLSSTGLLSSPQVTQADFSSQPGGLYYTFTVQAKDSNGSPSSAVSFHLTISQGLTITTASPLPSGTLGVAYQGAGLQLLATGGSGDYSWEIINGGLPGGLSMTGTGLISGIPNTSVSQEQFTVEVIDYGSGLSVAPTATKTFTISIVSSQLSIIQTTLPVGFQNQSYSTTLSAQGGVPPYTWSLGTNTVPGLSIASSTGVLSGVPTNSPGTYSITVIVNDSAGGSNQVTFAIQIAGSLSVGNATSTGVCQSGTPSLPNGTTGQGYTGTVCVLGGQAPFTWSLTAGSLPPGLQLQSSTGNTDTISGTPTSNGVYQFTVQVTGTGGGSATAALQIQVGPGISITTTTLPSGSQGASYTGGNVVATGGQTPYTWTIASGSLPAGLTSTTSSDTTTFIISGTPTGQGTSQFTVQVTDAQGHSAQQALSITVAVPLVITSVAVPNGTVGVAYSAPLGASGGTPPYTWSVITGTLPGGLTLNSSNGLLSGTPTTSGNYSFSIQARDATGATAQRAFSISVISQLTLNPGNFTGQVGTAFSQTLTASGGVPPYTYAIQAGTLPAGVSFSGSTGSFSGTPTAAGTSSVTVGVTDATGSTATAAVTITVSLNTPPPLTLGSIAPTPNAQPALSLTLGSTFSATLTGTVVLTFVSSVGGDDQTVGFTNGTRSATFTIPAGQTTATFPTGSFGVRTGTVAGTITIAVTQLAAGTTSVLPSPAPQIQIVIPPSAPVITAVSCAASSLGFTVSVTGYTTTRSMVSGTFTFTAPSGSTLQSNSTLVQLATPFSNWFSGTTANATGGQFLLTMPFTISQGSASGLGVSVALGNSVSGSNSMSATCQ